MKIITIRKELKQYIGAIPENNLEIIRPMLSFLASIKPSKDSLVIETNLTDKEKTIIKAGRKERKEYPESFTPWASVKSSQKKVGKK